MKKKVLIAFMVLGTMMGITNFAFGCAMSCAAICRYTCEGTPISQTGCSEADYASSLQTCCTQAFQNTPGINDVPCTVSGGES